MSPRPHFVIDIIELPFTLGAANIQINTIRFTGADLKQDVFASVWRLAMIEYTLMPYTELICNERHKPA